MTWNKFLEKKMKHTWLLLGICALGACAPQIYVVDRHTVLEEEAAGEWPDFERNALERSTQSGPIPFRKTPAGPKKKRLYNTLNGEMK